jgi:PAS domain S-box-containing protein
MAHMMETHNGRQGYSSGHARHYCAQAGGTAAHRKPGSLRESALHTQTVLDNMVDGVITINVHGLVESFNRAASSIFGYAPEEVLGRNVSMLMPEFHRGHYDDYLQHYQNTGVAHVIGTHRCRSTGTLEPRHARHGGTGTFHPAGRRNRNDPAPGSVGA